MGKAIFHARSSANLFGGKAEDYLDIHEFIDSSRKVFGDFRHRALTHHTFFLTEFLPLKFGQVRTNSDNREYSVLEVGEQHVREDFNGMIPSPSDFLGAIEIWEWMIEGKGTSPPSKEKMVKPKAKPKKKNKKTPTFVPDFNRSGILDGVTKKASTPMRSGPFLGKID